VSREGAYLVIVRAEDQFASGLVLVSPLTMTVRRYADSGRLRLTMTDCRDQSQCPNLHVRIIDDASRRLRSGETDLRGIFVADDVPRDATIIVYGGGARYAVHCPMPEQHTSDSSALSRSLTLPSVLPEAEPDAPIREKLAQIIIPHFQSDDLSVKDAVKVLRRRSLELDPDGEGVNIVLLAGIDASDARALTLRTEGRSLGELIGLICRELMRRHWVEPSAVILAHREAPVEALRWTTARGLTTGGTPAMRQQLDRIVVPQVDFDQCPMSDVVRLLQRRSMELDPDGEGVPIELQVREGRSADASVSLYLENVPLREVIRYACMTAGFGVALVDDRVVVTDAPMDRGKDLRGPAVVGEPDRAILGSAAALPGSFRRPLERRVEELQKRYFEGWRARARTYAVHPEAP